MIVKAPLAKSKGNTFQEYLLKVLLKVVSFGTFIHIYTHMFDLSWIWPTLRVDFCQLQLFLQQNGQLVRVEQYWVVPNVWRVLKWRWTTSHQYEKKLFEPTKLKNNYTCFQKLILCVLHSQSCTRMKTFRHNKCWQLTWMVDQVQKYTFEPSSLFTKKYTNKKHGPSSMGTGVNKTVALHCETVAQIHGESRDALQCPWWCNGLGRAAVGTTPEFLSGRHVATLPAMLLHDAQKTWSVNTLLISNMSSFSFFKKRHCSKQEKW